MGFKVYQGDIKDTNQLSPGGKKPVFMAGSGNKVRFGLEQPDPSDGKGPKPVSQPADLISVYINEAGRDVTVVWDPSAGTQPQVAAPRTQQTTVASPGPGQWLVTPGADNMSENRIDGADVMADIPNGWQSGSSIKFTTSRCGLDTYIVTYRSNPAKPQFTHVVVTVRKRVTCHVFEMKRTAASDDSDTVQEFRRPLRDVQTLLSGQFGIDLVLWNNKTREGVTAFHPTRTKSQLFSMIPAAKAAGRPPRELWINAVFAISGAEAGWGGTSQVHVEIKKSSESKKTYEKLQQSWDQFGGRGSKEDWARRFSPPLQGDLRKVAFQLADGAITPDEMANLELRNLLLHEIGHALGLVPSDEKAGGLAQDRWRDHSHTGHCLSKTCVMYWEGEIASVGFAAQMQKDAPFDHPKGLGCMGFMAACDLTDLRRLPG